MSRENFKSRAPKILAEGSFEPREGVFIGELIGAQLYWSTTFGAPQNANIAAREHCDLNIGLTFAIEDPDSDNTPMENDPEGRFRHTEGFIRLQIDKDGNFGPGGPRAKANKIMSGLLGASFNAYEEDFVFALYGPDLEKYSDIYEIPHFQEYPKGEEWLALTEISIGDVNLIGRKAQLQFGYADKPGGGRSDKLSLINAIAMPSSSRKKAGPKSGMKSGAAKKGEQASGGVHDVTDTPLDKPATPPAPSRVDVSSMPQHVRWVIGRMATPPLSIQEAHWLPFLQYLTEDGAGGPIATLEDLDRLDAKTFKGLYEADNGEQLAAMYQEWAKLRALGSVKDVAAEEEGDDEFGDDDLPF